MEHAVDEGDDPLPRDHVGASVEEVGVMPSTATAAVAMVAGGDGDDARTTTVVSTPSSTGLVTFWSACPTTC